MGLAKCRGIGLGSDAPQIARQTDGRNPKMKASKLRLRGFTLIELAVMMAIIAIDLNIS